MAVPAAQGDLQGSYEECIRLARGHYENFSVVTRLLPREMLPHVAALYAFCRTVDDLGDEAPGDRLALLDLWEADLLRCYSGDPQHPYLRALQRTIGAFDLPQEPFLKLVEANRMDQRRGRYPTFQELLIYCDHSANPVGRLYLALMGYRDQERQRLSDLTCTALQLANFWQDVARDYARGRVYIPQEDLERFGCAEGVLGEAVAIGPFRRLMEFQVERARGMFRQGMPLAGMVRGVARLHVRLFTLGGLRVLNAIRGQGYDVLRKRPVVTRGRKAWLLLSTYLGLWLTGALKDTAGRQSPTAAQRAPGRRT